MTGMRHAAGVLGVALGLAAGVAPAAAHPLAARDGAGGGIEGFVFLDVDADGRLDPDETGVRIVPVRLEGPVNRTVLSTMNGAFRFEDLPAGTYDVAVEPGLGWQALSQAEYAGLSVDGDWLQDVNFALRSAPGAGNGDGAEAGGIGAATDLTDETAAMDAAAGEAADDAPSVSPAALAAAAGLIGAASDDTVDAATLEAALGAARAGAIDQPVVDVLAQALAAVSEDPDAGGSDATPAEAPFGGSLEVADGTTSAGGPAAGSETSDAAWPVAWSRTADASDVAGGRRAGAAPPAGAAPAAGSPWPGMPQTGAAPVGPGLVAMLLGLVATGAVGLSIERARRPG